MKKIVDIKKEFSVMDEHLEQAKKDLKEMVKFRSRLREISKNIKTLEEFYHSEDWLDDRDTLHENLTGTEYYESAGEDPIWIVSQEFYEQKIKLLKQLAKEL